MYGADETLQVASLQVGDALVIAIIVAVFLLLTVLPVTVSFLKGRPWLAVLGLLLAMPLAWWGTIRPARPDSWWARNRYTPEQVAQAEALYAPKSPQSPAASFPEGWYADPWNEGARRYWDGAEWTGHVEGSEGPPPPPDGPPPTPPAA